MSYLYVNVIRKGQLVTTVHRDDCQSLHQVGRRMTVGIPAPDHQAALAPRTRLCQMCRPYREETR